MTSPLTRKDASAGATGRASDGARWFGASARGCVPDSVSIAPFHSRGSASPRGRVARGRGPCDPDRLPCASSGCVAHLGTSRDPWLRQGIGGSVSARELSSCKGVGKVLEICSSFPATHELFRLKESWKPPTFCGGR